MSKSTTDTMRMLPPAEARKFDAHKRRTVPTLLKMRYGDFASAKPRTIPAGQCYAAMAALQATSLAIAEAHFIYSADLTMTEAGRAARSRDNAKQRMQVVNAQADGAIKGAEALLSTLKAQLDEALVPAAHIGRAGVDQELRQHLRALVQRDPAAALAALRTDPDLQRVAAQAPAILTGLNSDSHRAAQIAHLESVMPEQLADYNDLRAALLGVVEAQKALVQDAALLVDTSTEGTDFTAVANAINEAVKV